jgi:hypothetical protein
MLDTKRLYRMARQLAYERARHECPEQVAEDLQQAGWVAYLKKGETAYTWKDIEYAMLEEISRWNWACKRGRGPSRNLRLKSEFKAGSSNSFDTLTPERLMIIREEWEERKKDRRLFPTREYKRKARSGDKIGS